MKTRMEQRCDLPGFRFEARQVWAFVQITVDTGKRQIVQVVTAAVKFRDDMLDVQSRQRRIVLAQPAIFATMSGALPDADFRRRVHRLRRRPDHLPRLALEDGDEFVSPYVAFVLRAFGLGELPFRRFTG